MCYFHVMKTMLNGLNTETEKVIKEDLQMLHHCPNPALWKVLCELVCAKWRNMGLQHIANHFITGYMDPSWCHWYISSVPMAGK